MKRRFVKLMSIALPFAGLLSSALPSRAQANFHLELVGPFVICEESTDLDIRLPDVSGTHYVPGLRAAFSEYPLDYASHYAINMLGLKTLGGGVFSGAMTIVPASLSSVNIALYGEKLASGCGGGSGTFALSFKVPKPDEIWPSAPADEIELVMDDNGVPKGQFSSGGRYASRVVLNYKNADLNTVKVSGLTNNWPKATDLGPDPTITLEVVPQSESNELGAHLQSSIAFLQMSQIIGSKRHLCFLGDNTPCPLVLVENQAALDAERKARSYWRDKGRLASHTMVPKSDGNMRILSTTAKDCHAPLVLICEASTACQ